MARSWRRQLTHTLAALAVAAAVVGTGAGAEAAAQPPRDTGRFACPVSTPNPFSDIAGNTHESAIRCMTRYGFVNGTTSTTFDPSSDVTRAQLASFLARGLAYTGVPLDTTDHGFVDVGGSPHAGAVNALANLNVIAGTSATRFQPNRFVTRAQAASMTARLLRLAGALPDGPNAFTDDEGSVHEASINSLAAAGITGGVTPDQFRPDAPITRAAAASILARVQDYAVEHRSSPPLGPTTLLLAAVRGSEVVPGPGDDAEATIELIDTGVDGLVCARWTVADGFGSAPTTAHVHRGAAGATGPAVLTIPGPDASAGTDRTTCAADLDPATVRAVFADPSAHHVDVHSAAHPDGAARGQLDRFAVALGTELAPGEVVGGSGVSGASGDATVEVLRDGTTLCAAIFYLGSGTPTAAHIHEAGAGDEGDVVVTLPPVAADGTGRGCVGGLDAGLLQQIAAAPSAFYVDVHTTAGEVRGQLDRSALLSTSLSGGANVPVGDPDGAGEAYLDLVGDGLVCLRLNIRSVGRPTAAHLHAGAPGTAGTLVAALPVPEFNTSSACFQIDLARFADLVARPGDHYVDVHTADAPEGAVRGQLASQIT